MRRAGRLSKPCGTSWTIPARMCWPFTQSIAGRGPSRFFRMLSDLRSLGFDAPICLYGFFPGLVWKEILDYCSAVDYVIVGEPEETMVDLARCIEAGIEVRVEGVALRRHGEASFPRMRAPIESPDGLAFPLRPSLESEQTVSVLASRGCYNQCSFCLVPALDQRQEHVAGTLAEKRRRRDLRTRFSGEKRLLLRRSQFCRSRQGGKRDGSRAGAPVGGPRDHLRHGDEGQRRNIWPYARTGGKPGLPGCSWALKAAGPMF